MLDEHADSETDSLRAVIPQAEELRQQSAARETQLNDMNKRLAASQREVSELHAARSLKPSKTTLWGRAKSSY